MKIQKTFKVLILVVALFLSVSSLAEAKRFKSGYSGSGSSSNSVYVHGYTKKNGTHVNSYYRTKANGTQRDNYGAEGNVNPHTGKVGRKKAKY